MLRGTGLQLVGWQTGTNSVEVTFLNDLVERGWDWLAKLPTATVNVLAFDQEVAAIYSGPATGFGDAQLKQLRARRALGASNVELALKAVQAKPTARVVIVGDGVFTAGATEGPNLTAAVLKLKGAGVKRLVFAGSSSAYGETPVLPKVETMAPDPLSPYAVSKLTGESYCKAFYRSYGVETVVLRYFNVFGPRQDPNSHYAAVIPRFITSAFRGESPVIFGDGEQSRDFCFIDNVVEANLKACTAPGAAGKVFNIACGERITLLDVIRALSAITGRAITPRHEPSRVGDIRHSLADTTRAREVLGYSGAIPFSEGLRRTVAWYRERV